MATDGDTILLALLSLTFLSSPSPLQNEERGLRIDRRLVFAGDLSGMRLEPGNYSTIGAIGLTETVTLVGHGPDDE